VATTQTDAAMRPRRRGGSCAWPADSISFTREPQRTGASASSPR
jgi:hypothetical protein